MKKCIYIIFLAICVCIQGCGDDEYFYEYQIELRRRTPDSWLECRDGEAFLCQRVGFGKVNELHVGKCELR